MSTFCKTRDARDFNLYTTLNEFDIFLLVYVAFVNFKVAGVSEPCITPEVSFLSNFFSDVDKTTGECCMQLDEAVCITIHDF